jgi:hypothetical protein
MPTRVSIGITLVFKNKSYSKKTVKNGHQIMRNSGPESIGSEGIQHAAARLRS